MHLKEKITFLLSPRLLTKLYILDSIKFLLKKHPEKFMGKKLLDLGCGSKPYAPLFEPLGVDYKGIDFEGYSLNKTYAAQRPDFFFSKNYGKTFRLPEIKSGSYEALASFEVLEHCSEPGVFFGEASRILKKGGHLLISLPFMWELHEEPHDFYRYSHFKIADFCEKNGLEIIETVPRGNALSTLVQLSSIAVTEQGWPYILRVAIYGLVFFPLQILTYLIAGHFSGPLEQRKILLGYTFLIRKK